MRKKLNSHGLFIEHFNLLPDCEDNNLAEAAVLSLLLTGVKFESTQILYPFLISCIFIGLKASLVN